MTGKFSGIRVGQLPAIGNGHLLIFFHGGDQLSDTGRVSRNSILGQKNKISASSLLRGQAAGAAMIKLSNRNSEKSGTSLPCQLRRLISR